MEPTVEQLREAVIEAVGASGLRAVARQVRMSPTGLSKFIDGAAPYNPTIRRLRQWHEAWVKADPERRLDEAVTALLVLVEPEDRNRVRAGLTRLLKSARLVRGVSLR
jgi:hypothetical protein